MGAGASKRATDLLLKVETLAARRPVGAPVCALFTGTPWSNTLAETWVWQRYLQPDALESLDLLSFDAWTAMFVDYATNIEVAPDGASFRMQRRPVGIVNTPELKAMLAEVAAGPAQVVVTVIGGQGFLLGRGNQQLSPRVIRALGADPLLVVAPEQKLVDLGGRPLLVDTGDPDLDASLAGHIRVLTGAAASAFYAVAAPEALVP
ncbi:MAG: hypothetical protein B7X41_16830 [Microbacterium sp. 14-71-5]|nr:MAG: hypothetical protein B7X41_16830 [Microbacterium sp. 14-71-5]